MIFSKKAAMFGLDARIALAIFGALSVISGASLYSAIQEARITARITQADNYAKAITQYLLDTGSMLPLSTTVPNSDLSSYALLEKPANVTGWNGPYISEEKHATGDYFLSRGSNVAVVYAKAQSWSGGRDCTQSDTNCNVYIAFLGDRELEDVYEERLDGTSVDLIDGNFRVSGIHSFFKTDIPFDPALSSTP